MKLMLHVTLEIHGRAIAYKIFYNLDEKKYFLKPDGLSFNLPRFQIWKSKGRWHFEGLEDKAVQEQAIAIMEHVVEATVKPAM